MTHLYSIPLRPFGHGIPKPLLDLDASVAMPHFTTSPPAILNRTFFHMPHTEEPWSRNELSVSGASVWRFVGTVLLAAAVADKRESPHCT